MAPPSVLRIELKPSPQLAALLLAAHALALFAAWASVSGWLLVVVAAGVSVSAAWSLAESLRRSGAAAVSLELREDGGAAWRDRSGDWHPARLGGGHFVGGRLIIAELREPDRRKWLVLLPDAAAPEDLRRLRLWLRWRRAPDLETGDGPPNSNNLSNS
jgi:hypothetical protein